MATIAIVHSGLSGHVGPATRLGATLVRQGHRVVAWGPEAFREQVEGTGTELHAHEPVPARGIFGGFAGFAATLAEATDRCASELIEALFAEEVQLVVHDCHAPWGLVAAEFLGIPRIVSNPLYPVPSPHFPPLESPIVVGRGSDEDFARAHEGRLTVERKWGIDVGDWRRTTLSVGDRTVSYTTPEIIGGAALRPGWRCVGPLMDSPPPRRETSGRPIVYIAFGTFSNIRPDLFNATIEAIADESVEAIVSTGRGLVTPASLQPLPPNVTVHEFVDSREVLSRAALHVTHGGGGSIHESLVAGVPMVCIPQGVDQSAWSHRIEALGAGRIMDADPGAIRAGLRRLAADQRVRARAAALGQALEHYDGEAQLTALVDEVLAEDQADGELVA